MDHHNERIIYKSIVVGMSICLLSGVVLGILADQIPIGILTGNITGLILGIAIGMFKRKNQE